MMVWKRTRTNLSKGIFAKASLIFLNETENTNQNENFIVLDLWTKLVVEH